VVSLSFQSVENRGLLADNQPYCSITVKDSGAGIPAENIDKIFTRFYRADSPENQKINGTGLGLPSHVNWVEAMRGHIFLTCERGTGNYIYRKDPFHKDSFTEIERSVITPEKQFDRIISSNCWNRK